MTSAADLERAASRLAKDTEASEEDYKILINGVDTTDEGKTIIVQNLYKSLKKYPNLRENALETQLALLHDSNNVVETNSIRYLFDFIEVNPRKVLSTIVTAINDKDGSISTMAKTSIRQHLPRSDKIFLNHFFSIMRDENTPKEQKSEMCDLLIRYFEFNNSNASIFTSCVETAFETNPLEALRIVKEHSDLIPVSERDNHVNDFLNSYYLRLIGDEYTQAIEECFIDISRRLLYKEGTAGQHFFQIVADAVLPKLSLLADKIQCQTLRAIADSSRFTSESLTSTLLDSLYTNIISHFGDTFCNAFTIEAALFCLTTLSKKSPSEALRVTGAVFALTGQNDKENEALRSKFIEALKKGEDSSKKTLEEAEKALAESSEDELRRHKKLAEEAKVATSNISEFASIFSQNPIPAKRPKRPSWRPASEKTAKPQQPQQPVKGQRPPHPKPKFSRPPSYDRSQRTSGYYGGRR